MTACREGAGLRCDLGHIGESRFVLFTCAWQVQPVARRLGTRGAISLGVGEGLTLFRELLERGAIRNGDQAVLDAHDASALPFA